MLKLLAEAIAAVDGAIPTGLKGNGTGVAALSTNSLKHGALATGTGCDTLAGVTAGLTALGLIVEALLSVELLLSCGEGELLTAVFANDCLVLEHGIPL